MLSFTLLQATRFEIRNIITVVSLVVNCQGIATVLSQKSQKGSDLIIRKYTSIYWN